MPLAQHTDSVFVELQGKEIVAGAPLGNQHDFMPKARGTENEDHTRLRSLVKLERRISSCLTEDTGQPISKRANEEICKEKRMITSHCLVWARENLERSGILIHQHTSEVPRPSCCVLFV